MSDYVDAILRTNRLTEMFGRSPLYDDKIFAEYN